MGAIDTSLACADPALLAAVVERELDPLVDRIDRDGLYPAAAMRALGAQGAFRHHLATQRADGLRDVAGALDALAAIGRSCGARRASATSRCVPPRSTCARSAPAEGRSPMCLT